eukprot:403371645
MIDTLGLSYNTIPVSTLYNLKYLPRLKTLDLTSNYLSQLPDDLSFLNQLEDLNLSYNLFSSKNQTYNANKLFVAFASMPRLKRLNLSNNNMEAIHYEELQVKKLNLNKLEELDLSNNQVQSQEELLYAQNFQRLMVLNLSENPIVQGENQTGEKIRELERLLYVKNQTTIMWRRQNIVSDTTPRNGGGETSKSNLAMRKKISNQLINGFNFKDDEYSKPLRVSSKNFKQFDNELNRMKNPQFNKGEAIPLSEFQSLNEGDQNLRQSFQISSGKNKKDIINHDSNYIKNINNDSQLRQSLNNFNNVYITQPNQQIIEENSAAANTQSNQSLRSLNQNPSFIGKTKLKCINKNAKELLLQNDHEYEFQNDESLKFYSAYRQLIQRNQNISNRRENYNNSDLIDDQKPYEMATASYIQKFGGISGHNSLKGSQKLSYYLTNQFHRRYIQEAHNSYQLNQFIQSAPNSPKFNETNSMNNYYRDFYKSPNKRQLLNDSQRSLLNQTSLGFASKNIDNFLNKSQTPLFQNNFSEQLVKKTSPSYLFEKHNVQLPLLMHGMQKNEKQNLFKKFKYSLKDQKIDRLLESLREKAQTQLKYKNRDDKDELNSIAKQARDLKKQYGFSDSENEFDEFDEQPPQYEGPDSPIKNMKLKIDKQQPVINQIKSRKSSFINKFED